MSVPQCVEPGNFNSTNNPLLPAIKNACILGGPIDINDSVLKAAHQYCCQDNNTGIVRENGCYLVCEVNQIYAIDKYHTCLAAKFKTTPAPMGIKEQCFGALVENPSASVDTLVYTPSATATGTDGPSATGTGTESYATSTPLTTTVSLSPTNSLIVSSVIVGSTAKPTASGNSTIPTTSSNSSSTGSASPSATSSQSKASRGELSMGATFVVGLAVLGLMI